MISVEATTIDMTNVPQLAVEEGSLAEYICVTGSSYPQPPTVLWFFNGMIANANDELTVNNHLPGEYQGVKTKNILRFTAKRAMNMKKVKCVLENDDTKFNQHNLNVACKFLRVYLCKA